jgi:hypothetical protein
VLGSPSRDQWGYHRGHPDRRNLDSFWTGPFFDGQSLGSFGFVMLLLAAVAATMPPEQVSGSDTLFVFLFALGGIFGPIASWVSLYRWVKRLHSSRPIPQRFTLKHLGVRQSRIPNLLDPPLEYGEHGLSKLPGEPNGSSRGKCPACSRFLPVQIRWPRLTANHRPRPCRGPIRTHACQRRLNSARYSPVEFCAV